MYLRKRRTTAMRLNLSIVAFSIVSLALTSGCASNFGEDEVNDPSLNTKSGEVANVGSARTPAAGEKQLQVVDTNPEQAIGSPADRVASREHFVAGSLGPAAGIGDVKANMDQDQQLKRSLIEAYAAGAADSPDEGAQTTVSGH